MFTFNLACFKIFGKHFYIPFLLFVNIPYNITRILRGTRLYRELKKKSAHSIGVSIIQTRYENKEMKLRIQYV